MKPHVLKTSRFQRIFSFNGRISRSEYWGSWAVLAASCYMLLIFNSYLILVSDGFVFIADAPIEKLGGVLIDLLVGVISSFTNNFYSTGCKASEGEILIVLAEFIAFFWVLLAAAVKRSQDVTKINSLEGFNVIFTPLRLFIADSETDENEHGLSPKVTRPQSINIALIVGWSWLTLLFFNPLEINHAAKPNPVELLTHLFLAGLIAVPLEWVSHRRDSGRLGLNVTLTAYLIITLVFTTQFSSINLLVEILPLAVMLIGLNHSTSKEWLKSESTKN
jgi:uncharacterized membrane protein YhaH (DUF805 family)